MVWTTNFRTIFMGRRSSSASVKAAGMRMVKVSKGCWCINSGRSWCTTSNHHGVTRRAKTTQTKLKRGFYHRYKEDIGLSPRWLLSASAPLVCGHESSRTAMKLNRAEVGLAFYDDPVIWCFWNTIFSQAVTLSHFEMPYHLCQRTGGWQKLRMRSISFVVKYQPQWWSAVKATQKRSTMTFNSRYWIWWTPRQTSSVGYALAWSSHATMRKATRGYVSSGSPMNFVAQEKPGYKKGHADQTWGISDWCR